MSPPLVGHQDRTPPSYPQYELGRFLTRLECYTVGLLLFHHQSYIDKRKLYLPQNLMLWLDLTLEDQAGSSPGGPGGRFNRMGFGRQSSLGYSKHLFSSNVSFLTSVSPLLVSSCGIRHAGRRMDGVVYTGLLAILEGLETGMSLLNQSAKSPFFRRSPPRPRVPEPQSSCETCSRCAVELRSTQQPFASLHGQIGILFPTKFFAIGKSAGLTCRSSGNYHPCFHSPLLLVLVWIFSAVCQEKVKIAYLCCFEALSALADPASLDHIDRLSSSRRARHDYESLSRSFHSLTSLIPAARDARTSSLQH